MEPLPLFDNEEVARSVLDQPRFNVLAQSRALWDSFRPYADDTFVTELREAVTGLHQHATPGPQRDKFFDVFHRRWWEMFVGVVLLDQGVTLVPRSEWDPMWKGAGPDFQANVEGRQTWVECIAPGAGFGPDAVPERSDDVVGEVPVDQIKLRLTSAIKTKRDQLVNHIKAGIVKANDAYVIAVNSRCVSHLVMVDDDPPWIARSLYGLGPLAVNFDVNTKEWSEPFIKPQLTIPRRGKEAEPIDADLFGSARAVEVSGVMYSHVDAWNLHGDPHSRLLFVHNRTAAVPLPSRWLPRSVSYAVTVNGKIGTITRSDPSTDTGAAPSRP